MATKRDLPAKKVVKGGKLAANDNLTLVRPVMTPLNSHSLVHERSTHRSTHMASKDLSVKKNIKGGAAKKK